VGLKNQIGLEKRPGCLKNQTSFGKMAFLKTKPSLKTSVPKKLKSYFKKPDA
jgi:hypothetical protein